MGPIVAMFAGAVKDVGCEYASSLTVWLHLSARASHMLPLLINRFAERRGADRRHLVIGQPNSFNSIANSWKLLNSALENGSRMEGPLAPAGIRRRAYSKILPKN